MFEKKAVHLKIKETITGSREMLPRDWIQTYKNVLTFTIVDVTHEKTLLTYYL